MGGSGSIPPYLDQTFSPIPGINRITGPSAGTRSRRGASADGPDSTVALPLRAVGPPPADQNELQVLQYWPFSSSDLYNWKANNPSFSENSAALTGLVESLMYSHQPTWDDCQQLLNTLFTTEERERIVTEARKTVREPAGQPALTAAEVDELFPITQPQWDYNTTAGRERLSIYRRALVAGLRGAARKPTNLAKVREIMQGSNEPPSVFLERLMEAYRIYTPFDPTSEGQRASAIMSFIGQSASDTKRKLQHIEGLQDYTLRMWLKRPRKYITREKRRKRKGRRQGAGKPQAGYLGDNRRQGPRRSGGGKGRIGLEKDQCAFCKEKGHWTRECPKRKGLKIMALEENED
ncbi:uncharacterized protein LOC133629252 [Colius striatus]|uniref:uncharacterized protein LOC133629252 n=1 Tax=Colius striatus TaxID=57412 RepID=UPI002B1D25D1|nr:uncharacterized protein LOC133629252 [Colius striatus]